MAIITIVTNEGEDQDSKIVGVLVSVILSTPQGELVRARAAMDALLVLRTDVYRHGLYYKQLFNDEVSTEGLRLTRLFPEDNQ